MVEKYTNVFYFNALGKIGGTIFQVDRIRADDLIEKKKVIEI